MVTRIPEPPNAPRSLRAAIAAKADLAVPTVYKHFGTKRRLLLALLDVTINARVAHRLAAVLEAATPRAQLAALARMCVDLAAGAPDVVSVALTASISDPELGAISERWPKHGEARRRSFPVVGRRGQPAQWRQRGAGARRDVRPGRP